MPTTSIEWTDRSWNPVTGCSRVSSGCDNCYAMNQARRFDGMGHGYDGTTRHDEETGVDWTGVVHEHSDRVENPLSWASESRVFVCSMGDLFHPKVTTGFLEEVFAVMAACSEHTFQILTKRPERMRDFLTHSMRPGMIGAAGKDLGLPEKALNESLSDWPLSNVWLGSSCEDQDAVEKRVPLLLQCPGETHFVSAEPLLGPVDLTAVETNAAQMFSPTVVPATGERLAHSEEVTETFNALSKGSAFPYRLDWVIVGGESGPGARPMHPDWVRGLLSQSRRHDVAFHLKQWGKWLPWEPTGDPPNWQAQTGDVRDRHVLFPANGMENSTMWDDGVQFAGTGVSEAAFQKVGKGGSGRELDGKTYDEFPE